MVSALGTGAEEFWNNCLAGAEVAAPIPDHWRDYASLRSELWAPLPPLDYGRFGLSRIEQLQHDPVSLQALAAAEQALAAAGIGRELVDPKLGRHRLAGPDPERCAVAIGTGCGGAYTLAGQAQHHLLAKPAAQLREWLKCDGAALAEEAQARLKQILAALTFPSRFNPFAVAMVMPNASAAALSIRYGLRGPAQTSCAACASGTVAIGQGYRAIRRGEADLVLAGGSEYLRDDHGEFFRCFDLTGALTAGTDAADYCPFDERHTGFLFSPGGAAVLVLEDLGHARERGAPILAEVAGFAENSEAYHAIALAPDGASLTDLLHRLLREAGLAAEEIDYINSHGTGTPLNDTVEAQVLEAVFGHRPAINSTKALLGHTLGASGALEAVVTASSLHHQTTHACKNLRNPIRDLNFVTSVRPLALQAAISHSCAFGGHNAALLLKRFEG